MMPGENGRDFAMSLRRDEQQVPVLMLSALAEPDDRIAGLASGSDDYLVKPFEPRELLLRINNLLRRAGRRDGQSLSVSFGEFQFVIARGELRRDGELVRLTSGEKELLRQLASRPGTPLSRQELVPSGQEDKARSVDVQINRLRQKIERDPANPLFLQTVRGAGYALFAEQG
jgi:two-component system, OmpR family, phosphate regulon response regulator OmpR